MTGPEENSGFCFPRISMFPETKSRETLRFKTNAKFENRAEIPAITCNSGQHLRFETNAKFENCAEIPAITCNSGQHFAGNSELFPV